MKSTVANLGLRKGEPTIESATNTVMILSSRSARGKHSAGSLRFFRHKSALDPEEGCCSSPPGRFTRMAKKKPELATIQDEVVGCRACPRLVAHREDIAARKTKRFADHEYWGRPVPSFGDPRAQLLIVGLAPAAHGANRTGRMFTGDRSGEWLFEAMHRYGFSNQSTSTASDDGLKLKNAYITAVVRCAPPANKPNRTETETCRAFLVRELVALRHTRVVLALGKVAFEGFLAAWAGIGGQMPRPKPKFAHRAVCTLSAGLHLLASYHPSQQNTFTGRLTRSMFHAVFRDAGALLGSSRN